MATKKAEVNKISVQEVIKPLLVPLTNATRQGDWNGIGGASDYLNKDKGRLASLKRFGGAFEQEAMCAIFMHIVDVTENIFDRPLVLQKFISSNPDILLLHAKKNPEYFRGKPKVAQLCAKELAGIDKSLYRKFDRLIKKECAEQQGIVAA